MINWNYILKVIKEGNAVSPRIVNRSLTEWKEVLSPELYKIAWEKKTERPDINKSCSVAPGGLYLCACCQALLFDTESKYDSQSGWPSFTQPIHAWAIRYKLDLSHGMQRVETMCNTCGAHLGHVFPDGPTDTGLRFCINEISLKKEDHRDEYIGRIVLGGGCFWCTEAIFREVVGVIRVTSGYAGGATSNPTYEEICSGKTGHAEVIAIEYDRYCLDYQKLLRIHLETHDPTTPNQQGYDKGTQYRSIVFYQNKEERSEAEAVLQEMQIQFDHPIVTEVRALKDFYPAEEYHHNYYEENPSKEYCQFVIKPKLEKAKKIINGIQKT